jgi:hypothetical protein
MVTLDTELGPRPKLLRWVVLQVMRCLLSQLTSWGRILAGRLSSYLGPEVSIIT